MKQPDKSSQIVEKAKSLYYRYGLTKHQAARIAIDELGTTEDLARLYSLFDITYYDLIETIINKI